MKSTVFPADLAMFGNATVPTFPTARWRPRIFARNKPAPAFISRPESAESATVEPASTTDTPAEERALIQRAQGGDLSAYDELVRRYQERVYATLYHMTSNHEDAHDLAQEAFVKAWQVLKSFKGDSSFYTWVYRIAVNKTINHLKTRRHRTPHLSLNDLDFNAEHDPGLVQFISDKTPRRDVALAELKEKLNAAMQKLSEEHRLTVTLYDIQGLSHEEIAKIMDCNTGTVRSRLYYARQQLQAYLSDYLKGDR